MRIRLIILLISFLFCSNCAIMNASEISEFKNAKVRHEVQRIRADNLEKQYLNLDKESIVQELGKPNEVIHRDLSYFRDQGCRKNGCPENKADEVWIYDFKISDDKGLNFTEIWVYIYNGKIVRIAG